MQCQFGPVSDRLSVCCSAETAGCAAGRYFWTPAGTAHSEEDGKQSPSVLKDVTRILFEGGMKGTKIETTDSR